MRTVVPRSIPRTKNLPGQIYSADEQCRMQYGKAARLCPSSIIGGLDMCSALYCQAEQSQCRSNLLPAAEGTICGINNDRWCRQGSCVKLESNGAVAPNSMWGSWGLSSRCLSTCGTGIKLRERQCLHGNCVGEKFSTHVCKGSPCELTEDPRETQCRSLNIPELTQTSEVKWRFYPEANSYRSCSLKCLREISYSS